MVRILSHVTRVYIIVCLSTVDSFLLKPRAQVLHHLVEHPWVHSYKVLKELTSPSLRCFISFSYIPYLCLFNTCNHSLVHTLFLRLILRFPDFDYLIAIAASKHAAALIISAWSSSRSILLELSRFYDC